MNPDFLIRGVLSSVLGVGYKQSSGALRFLRGDRGSFLTRPATLLTAAGVAWGIYETLQQQKNAAQSGTSGAPPLPVASSAASQDATVPPLPRLTEMATEQEALRVVRLAVSAAAADGVMSEKERALVLQQAQSAGVGDVVERELNHRRPLAEIVAGVTDPVERATLYVLAFTVLRADEQVSGAERIYLAQLAHLLHLDPDTVQRLETNAGERIDSLGDQGQLGG
jgi:uncharacterized membrane protein YebE (DUF533 family)